MTTIRVWYINHGYFAQTEFSRLDVALAYGRSRGFEFTAQSDGAVLASWSPISGLRMEPAGETRLDDDALRACGVGHLASVRS